MVNNTDKLCTLCTFSNTVKPVKDEDSLNIKEISLDKQPKNRLSKAKRKALKKLTASSSASELLSDSDNSDASMEVCHNL